VTPTGPPTTPSRRVRPSGHRRRVLAVAAVSAVVVAAGVGAAVAAVGPRSVLPGPEASAAPGTPTTTAPALTVPPAAAPDTVPPVAGAPLSPGTSAAAPDTPADLQGRPGDPVSEDDVRRTVSQYYASLPGDIPGAWSYLSGDAQDASGGFGGYQAFWSGITSVTADDVQVDGTSARAQLDFVTDHGRTSRESYHFEVDRNDQGRLEIRSAARGGADSA
jgi:eukaryotic-like serine/threonine-protein kinase